MNLAYISGKPGGVSLALAAVGLVCFGLAGVIVVVEWSLHHPNPPTSTVWSAVGLAIIGGVSVCLALLLK